MRGGARKRNRGTGRTPLTRLAWGLAGLVLLLLAMSAVSGKLRSGGPSAGEDLQASGAVAEGGVSAEDGGAAGVPDADAGPVSGEAADADERMPASREAGSGEDGGVAGSAAENVTEAGADEGPSRGAGGDTAADAGMDTAPGNTDGAAPAGRVEAAAGEEEPTSPGVVATETGGTVEETDTGTGGYLSLEGGDTSVPDLGRSLLKVLLSLGVVAALVLATRAFLRRAGRKGRRGAGDTYLKVIGFTPLGNGTGVHEVRVGERVWFIAEGEKELRLLGDLDLGELEVSRLARAEPEGGEFDALVERSLPSRSDEWRGTLPKGWLNALRWKTAR